MKFNKKIIVILVTGLFLLLINYCDNSIKPKNKPLTCEITSPAENSEIEQGDIVKILVDAGDEDGDVKEVRFYVDGIGKYSTTSFPYNYEWNTINADLGQHTIKATVEDDDNLESNDEVSITLVQGNTAPTALFTVSPETGTTATTFTFDGSGCTDNEDNSSQLQVRWDWENDGTWDTDYSMEKTATHQFTSAGEYDITLEVMNSEGATGTFTETLTVSEAGNDDIEYGEVTDIDGNTYKTVIIGNQEWMAENLKVTRYRNGEPIPNITDAGEWSGLTTGAYCVYNNDESNVDTYGYLYNWYAVTDSRNIAPEGWHVPTDEEWTTLSNFIGDNAGTKLKSTTGWNSGGNGTDDYGFAGLPAGYRYNGGNYRYMGDFVFFWSATEYGSYSAWGQRLFYNSTEFNRDYYSKEYGLSVRLLRDNENTNHLPTIATLDQNTSDLTVTITAQITDIDGNLSEVEIEWGDGNTRTVTSGFATIEENYTYTSANTYNVKLTATDDDGASTSQDISVTVTGGGDIEYGEVTDIDGNTYKTVIIGNQEWMAENLKVTRYRNGEPIPNITDAEEWSELTIGAYCAYDNDESNVDTYGYLYNWYTGNIAPEGWHVPTDEEWTTLSNFIGDNAGTKLKSTTGWNSGGNGTDDYGFAGLPAGYRGSSGTFLNIGNYATFWSASEYNTSSAWSRLLYYTSSDIYRSHYYKADGFSVRCVRD